MTVDLTGYRYIVGYGIGQYYDYIRSRLPRRLRLDFLCDARWERIGEVYDGTAVISPEKLEAMEDVFVIVFSGNGRNWQSISAMLDAMGHPYAHADQFLEEKRVVSGGELRTLKEGVWQDSRGNRIEFFNDIEASVFVDFQGGNNLVRIGKGVSVGRLHIQCGKDSVCSIGRGTEIEEADIIVTDGMVSIGENCLLSTGIIMRNHDKHHIFDKDSGKRINYAGNMTIGNHVWICRGATLLGSAAVGDNSIVGTMAVTSSAFPREVILAGNPARIVRENVCWSKDNTNFYKRDFLKDCLAQEALLYF